MKSLDVISELINGMIDEWEKKILKDEREEREEKEQEVDFAKGAVLDYDLESVCTSLDSISDFKMELENLEDLTNELMPMQEPGEDLRIRWRSIYSSLKSMEEAENAKTSKSEV